MIYLVRTPKVVFERRTKSKRFLVSMTTSMRLCVCVYITAQRGEYKWRNSNFFSFSVL